MRKYKIIIVALVIVSIFAVSMVAFASPGSVKKEPSAKAKQIEKEKGMRMEMDVPITIKTLDGKTYKTTTKDLIKNKAKIEKKLGIKL